MDSELWNCPSAFEFKCPLKWSKLKKTRDAAVRFCKVCKQEVYLCSTPEEFVEHGNRGHCVAVPEGRTPETATELFMGRIGPSAIKELTRRRKPAQDWWRAVLADKPRFEREAMAAIATRLEEGVD